MNGSDWVQAVGWTAAAVSVLSYQAKGRDGVLLMQAVSCLLLIVHYIGLESPVGAMFNLLAMLRGLTALINRPWRRFLVLGFLPLSWGLTAVTAHHLVDLLPALAITCSTVAQASVQVLRLRLFMLASGPLWFLFAMLAGSQGGMAMELLNIGSNGVALYRYHWRAPRIHPVILAAE